VNDQQSPPPSDPGEETLTSSDDPETVAGDKGGTRPEMVDDRYWLKRATVFFDAAISSRQEAAGRLVTATGWFWTVYTAVAIVGSSLANRQLELWATLLVALPILLLVAAYLVCLRATMPYDGLTRPADPKAVEESYRAALAEKKKHLRQAFLATGIAAGFVLIAALTVALSPPEPIGDVTVAVESTDSGVDIMLDGEFAPDQEVVVTVTTEGESGAQEEVAREIGRANSNGDLEELVSVTTEAEKGQVSIVWTDGEKRTHEVSQQIAF
jgi:hypothetical protein